MPHGVMSQGFRSPRVERRVQAFHRRVLAAASALFSEEGIEATKIDDICKVADVAKRTLCNHFPTKTHIVKALSRRSIVDFVEMIEEARDRGTTNRQRLDILFRGFAARTLERGSLNRALVGELFNAAHDREIGAEGEVLVSDALRSLLNAGGPGQLPANTSAETLADIVLGSIYVSMLEWIHRDDYDFEKSILGKAAFLVSLLPEVAADVLPIKDERRKFEKARDR